MSLTIFITIYFLSAFAWWKFVQLAHSKNGRWYFSKPDSGDVFIMFAPIVNTLFAVLAWGRDQ
jgi:hypothetical protein